MLWLCATLELILLFQIGASGVQSSSGSVSRCDETKDQTFFTARCILCPLNRYVQCPPGSQKLTTGEGIKRCRIILNMGWVNRAVVGCVHRCRRKVVTRKCCRGFWGYDCRPCPGVESGKGPCYGKGKCSDLNGTCQCNVGFGGFACEKCSNKNMFGPKCQQNCNCKNGICSGGVSGNGMCQPYTCKLGYHGENCDKFERNCSKTCHINAHCVVNKTASCVCNPGYRGDGSRCQGINPCHEAKNRCPSNTDCQQTGPGRHKCVCKIGFTGDGTVCTAIDHCQFNNGNCSSNSLCNYQGPGKFNCSCIPGYENYVQGKGCSITDLCSSANCSDVNAECYMVKPFQKSCRCKVGYVGNGTTCYGNVLQRIDDLNRDGPFKNKFTLSKRFITRHTSLTRPLTGEGPFTLFIPTNDGLIRNLTSKQRSKIYQDAEVASHFIFLHTVSGYLTTSEFANNGNLTTLKGVDAVVSRNGYFFYQLLGQSFNSKIITTDILASNGIIHILDLPAWKPDITNIRSTSSLTLWQIIDQKPELQTLRLYIQIAGLKPDLAISSAQGITVVAPVNEAFKALEDGIAKFLKTAQGKVKLQAILRHHIYDKKIGVTEMINKRTMTSRASTLVDVSVKDQGAVILADVAKLVQTNIPASNGVLHLSNALLIPSFVKPIHSRRCDKNSTRVVHSPCNSCARKFVNDNCPFGTISTGQKTMCLFYIPNFLFTRVYRGCKTRCVYVEKHCCPGFYGQSCATCPGPVGNPCFGNGKCSDDIKGDGTCACNNTFTGTACELCRNPKTFGLSCNKTCTCVHGECKGGRNGNGSCRVGTCKDGYFGSECATMLRQCGYQRIPCSINAQCYLSKTVPKCICKSGYEGDGVNCYEIDPCQKAGRGGCHRNAMCDKTGPGTSKCTCSPGWTGDGAYCTPIDYCATASHGFCHKYAKCVLVGPGKVNCVCYPGYEGDGISCKEINTCLINNGNCSPLARCTKVGPGLNNCNCRFGYIGDGYECLPSLSVVMMGRKDLTKIYRLILKSNLVRYLTMATTNVTIFVPSDSAMNKLNESVKAILAFPQNLIYFGGSNMARGLYTSAELRNLTHLESFIENIYINISLSNESQLVVGGVAKVKVSDITASNGIMHIVDNVLLPPFDLRPLKEDDLYQSLCNQTDFSEICTFIKKFHMESILKSCNYCTIFAPHNQVFHDLPHNQYDKFNSSDLKYHITEHYIPPWSIRDGQQFSTLAGTYYILALEKKKKIKVNGVPVTLFRFAHSWVIYNISSILTPTRNFCFKNAQSTVKVANCRPCWYTRCPTGYSYAGSEPCVYWPFYLPHRGCRTICRKPVQIRSCCPGFYGKFCDACPGGSGNECFGNGDCHDGMNGSGACNCDEGFNGTACERCTSKGHYGEKCRKCDCNSGTCDQKHGFCICPSNWKGMKCDVKASNSTCGNSTCHQHASCNKNNSKCQCDYGFTGNGTYCSHIDPCNFDNGGCSPHAKCIFTSGRRNCTCRANYEGDGYYCQGVNPCKSSSSGCDPNAQCLYFRPGRRKCVCKAGYSGNGTNCSPFNPCLENNGGCSVFAVCSYERKLSVLSCKCREGYIGNGIECAGNLIESLQRNPDLSEFYSHLQSSTVQEIISPEQTFSIIAPNNKAFTASSRRKRRSVVDFSETDLKYYIVSCVPINEADINVTGNSFVTVAGSWLNITSPAVINDDVNILSVKKAKNGAILIVDQLLKASAASLSNSSVPFIKAARSNGYLQFIHLLTVAGILDVVSNRYIQPFTMFWPTDGAIARLPDDIKDRLLSGNYTSELRDILNYHVISQTKITTEDILRYAGGLARRTQEGTSLYISCKGHKGDIYINDRSRIVQRDIELLEGVAFGISEVLLPPGVAGRCDEITYNQTKGSCTFCNGTGICPPGAILQSVDQTASCYVQDKYLGCLSRCLRRIKTKKCCKNFYGPDCQACPGGVRNPCSGRGSCSAGVRGNGSCSCNEPYFGKACEQCPVSDTKCERVDIVFKSCTSRNNPCSVFALCNASDPQICKCIDGYEGDGFYCQEIDPCQKSNGICSRDAICTYLGPNSARCRCRPGYVGDGRSCSALPPSHRCATDNGNCHIHARCDDKGGAAVCTCRDGFAGNGKFCGGSVMQVIYDIEELSEFAKAFRHLIYGVEGSDVIRWLSSEMDYTVFAPINYGFTVKKMTIYELKNHIVQGKHEIKSGPKLTFDSLAGNRITVVMTKNMRGRVNNIANVLYDYPATNGIIHIVDHVLPYTKPRPTSPPPTGTTKVPERSESPAAHIQAHHDKKSLGQLIGIVFGVVVPVLFVLLILIYLKKRRNTPVVRYKKNFESVCFESEPFTEEDHLDEEDDYEHPELQHPSVEDDSNFVTNPSYKDQRTSSGEHLEMTETSSIVPLTQYDESAFGEENNTDC